MPGMDAPLVMPAGFTIRPCVRSDLPAIFEVVAASELDADGAIELSLSDVESDWARPDFDPQTMSIGIALNHDFEGESEGWVQQLAVEKVHRGRGLGGRSSSRASGVSSGSAGVRAGSRPTRGPERSVCTCMSA